MIEVVGAVGQGGGDGCMSGDSRQGSPIFVIGERTIFCGKSKVYDVETYNSGRDTFTGMFQYSGLVDLVTSLYLGIYPDRDKELSLRRVRAGLNHPRTILEIFKHEGVPVGFGIFPRFFVAEEYEVYSSRGFLKGHEGEGAGTYALMEAIILHQEELTKGHRILRGGALMTQSAASIATLWKLPFVTDTFPIHLSTSADGQKEPVLNLYPQGSIPQRMMLGTHSIVYMSSRSINTNTGVSKGELSELGMNESYRPSRDNLLLYKTHQLMVSPSPEGLDANREAGDEVYVTMLFDQTALSAIVKARAA